MCVYIYIYIYIYVYPSDTPPSPLTLVFCSFLGLAGPPTRGPRGISAREARRPCRVRERHAPCKGFTIISTAYVSIIHINTMMF